MELSSFEESERIGETNTFLKEPDLVFKMGSWQLEGVEEASTNIKQEGLEKIGQLRVPDAAANFSEIVIKEEEEENITEEVYSSTSGAESNVNIFWTVIKEEERSFTEEVLPSPSRIGESCVNVKNEPELDVPIESGQLGVPESAANLSEIVIKKEEENVTEEVYSSNSGIGKKNTHIKSEPELDIETETGLLGGRGGWCYVCHHCQRNFALFKQLRTHVKFCFSKLYPYLPSSEAQKLHSPNVPASVNINSTDKSQAFYNLREILPLSPQKHHLPPEYSSGPIYFCPHCNYSTTVNETLHTHLKSLHFDRYHVMSKSVDKRHSCLHCDYSTVSSFNLKCHVMAKHANDKPHSCPHCDYRTITSRNLKRHIMARHTNEKPHSCPHCDYSAAQVSQLNRHIMAKHTTEKPHSCPYCDFRSVGSGELKFHIMAKHTNEKPHSCPDCDYSAVRFQQLKCHIMVKHTIARPHSCPHCDYSSSMSRSLKHHIMSKHTFEHPYCCPHCDYSTVRSPRLKLHIMAKHTNEKPHSCPHCDYRAVELKHLKHHLMAKHNY